MRHLITPMDLTVEETLDILDLAERIRSNPVLYRHVADGRQLATLFYEPSTRTRLSFESAMLSLGGQTLGFSSAEQSSATKGETVADTTRVISCYADIIAMRHPKEGAPLRASMYSKIPVINAGDGGHAHPTQTMIDLMTIRQRKGKLDHLTIGFCGDLKFGRTVHSLVSSLVRFPENQFYFISPEELCIPDYMKTDVLDPTHSIYKEVFSLPFLSWYGVPYTLQIGMRCSTAYWITSFFGQNPICDCSFHHGLNSFFIVVIHGTLHFGTD